MKITEQIKISIAEAVKEWLSQEGKEFTQSELARKTNVNNAIVSLIKRGTFVNGKSPIADEEFVKLAQFLNPSLVEYSPTQTLPSGEGLNEDGFSKERLRQIVGSYHFNTENFGLVIKMAMTMSNTNSQGILDSKISGAGKTYALEVCSKLFPKTYYYKASGKVTPSEFLLGILKSMGVKEFKGNNSKKIDEIVRLMPYNGLLVIDELETVQRKNTVYPILKDLIDKAKGNFGMIASGHGLLEFFRKKAEKGKDNYPQLYRRLENKKTILYNIRKKEEKDKGQEGDLEIITGQFGGVRELTLRWMYDNIKNYDSLRTYLMAIMEIDKKANNESQLISALNKLISGAQKLSKEEMDRFSI
jgi:hypothetical protein